MLHLTIDIEPLLDPKQEHWFKLIRYCLYCLHQVGSESVVFAAPTAGHLELFILSNNAILAERDWSEQQRHIKQVLAIQIGLWLTRPGYLTMPIGGESRPLLYVARAIYETLAEHRAETIYQFKNRLEEHYQIECKDVRQRGRLASLNYQYQKLGWIGTGENSLSWTDINSWLKFNQFFKNSPVIDRFQQACKLLTF